MRRLLLVLALGAVPATAQGQVCPELVCPATATPAPTASPSATATATPSRPAPVGPVPQVTGSVTVGIDPGHRNWLPGDGVVAPLRVRWSRRDVPAAALVAGEGRIFAADGRRLIALDARSGRTVWKAGVDASAAAFDAGRVYVFTGGRIVAFGAEDGDRLWSRTLDDTYRLSTAPVATGGVVYVSDDSGTSSIIALDGATGERYWSSYGSGTGNTPAVDDSAVYASYACGLTDSWDRVTGALRWATTSDCSGGGGSVAAVADGRVYVPEDETVRRVTDGSRIARYPGGTPVLADRTDIFSVSAGLRAVDRATGRRLWQRRPPAGDEGLYAGTSLPAALGSTVYVVQNGVLSAFAVRTGRQLWTTRPPLPSFTQSGLQLAAAPGLLLVAGGSRLTAYESFFSPAAGQVQAAPERSFIFAGRKVRVAGRVGSGLRGRRVAVEVARAPHRRFRRVASVRPRSDGGFSLSFRADRNVRVRARSGSRHSRPVRVSVYPRVRFRVRQAAGVVRATMRVRAAHDVRLSGRRIVLYLGRRHRKRYERLGSASLSGSRGRATATVVFAPVDHVGQRDFLTTCLVGQVRLGLGGPDRLTRRCGSGAVPF